MSEADQHTLSTTLQEPDDELMIDALQIDGRGGRATLQLLSNYRVAVHNSLVVLICSRTDGAHQGAHVIIPLTVRESGNDVTLSGSEAGVEDPIGRLIDMCDQRQLHLADLVHQAHQHELEDHVDQADEDDEDDEEADG